MVEKKNMFREVWCSNRSEEITSIQNCLRNYRFIAIDTEFPGCLRQTPMDATNEERNKDLTFNVDNTKLIQLGLTLFNADGEIGGSWEVNFSDFCENEDVNYGKSLEFLKRNGVDLKKIREQGIGVKEFFSDFSWILKRTKNVTWVTFHGLYDIAYLLKYFTGKYLPVSSKTFSKEVARLLGPVYDLKVMAGRYEGLSSRLGLQSLGNELGVNRFGTAHHAGSDSELTARVFVEMVHVFDNVKESEGLVYGLGNRIISGRLKEEIVMMRHVCDDVMIQPFMRRCYGPGPPPQPMFLQPMPQLNPIFVGFPTFMVPSVMY